MSDWSRAASDFESKPQTLVSWPWFVGLPTVALGLQTQLSLLEPALGLLNLPFVATINLLLRCRSTVSVMPLAALVGCLQDGLTHGPVGLYGIAYTICGYLVVRFRPYVRFDHVLELSLWFAGAYATHELVFGIVRSSLVGGAGETNLVLALFVTVLHAGACLFVFNMLSKAVGKP